MITSTPIPEGYHTATPYLIVRGAAQAIEFYKNAFGARENLRVNAPGGMIGHAEIQIGNSRIMLADEFPQMGFKGPQSLGGTPTGIVLYVENADAAFAQAVAAGANVVKPMQDQFYGDRSGTVTDPFGHLWTIGSRKENLSAAEIEKRAAAFHKSTS